MVHRCDHNYEGERKKIQKGAAQFKDHISQLKTMVHSINPDQEKKKEMTDDDLV